MEGCFEDIILNISSPIKTPTGKTYPSLQDFISAANPSRLRHPWLETQFDLLQQYCYLNQTLIFGETQPTPQNLKNFPVLAMTDGEIVAYRLNQTSLPVTSEHRDAAYSSSFVLVRSVCKPDPQQPTSWLEFFTLYQGLASLADIHSSTGLYQAKTKLVQRRVESTAHTDVDRDAEIVPDKTNLFVQAGERMQVTLRKNFLNGSQRQPFGLARKLDANQQPTGNPFWVTLLPEYVDQLTPYQALTRVVMRTATESNTHLQDTDMPTAPSKSGQVLNKGEHVLVRQNHRFNNNGEIQPFGLARKIDATGREIGDLFWITTLPEFLKPISPHADGLPWLQQAIDLGIYDDVVVPAQPIAIKSGEEIAYPGLHLTELSDEKLNSEYGVYIELLIKDPTLNDFLTNPSNNTAGLASVHLRKNASIYRREGVGKNSTFTKTTETLHNHDFDMRSLATLHPLTDNQGQHWYQASKNQWVSATETDLVHQFDLLQLGFSTVNYQPKHLTKVKTCGFRQLISCLLSSIGVKQSRQALAAHTHYQALLAEIDADKDGVLSNAEIQQARQQVTTPVAQLASRLLLQHPSIWAEEHQYSALREQLSSLDASRQDRLKTWFSQQRWIAKFTELSREAYYWTADPLVFLNALANKLDEFYEFETALGNYQISYKSAQFILSWEAYADKPYVPAGSATSGVTVGYGYDLGQQSVSSARHILSSYYSAEQVNRLLTCIGKKGKNAKAMIPSIADITISRENAFRMALDLKKIYSQAVIKVYPQAIDLPPDSAGAILSLIYNRGSSLALPQAGDTLDSRKEMREIQQDFANNQIEKIPARIRSMKRLWPNSLGLIKRREGEAVLIEQELARLTRKR